MQIKHPWRPFLRTSKYSPRAKSKSWSEKQRAATLQGPQPLCTLLSVSVCLCHCHICHSLFLLPARSFSILESFLVSYFFYITFPFTVFISSYSLTSLMLFYSPVANLLVPAIFFILPSLFPPICFPSHHFSACSLPFVFTAQLYWLSIFCHEHLCNSTLPSQPHIYFTCVHCSSVSVLTIHLCQGYSVFLACFLEVHTHLLCD